MTMRATPTAHSHPILLIDQSEKGGMLILSGLPQVNVVACDSLDGRTTKIGMNQELLVL